MASLNGLYIFVTSEELSSSVDVTEHVVESGIDIADHVRRRAFTLSISGEIVGQNATSILSQIRKMHNSGNVVKYSGRNITTNCIITDFSTSHPNTIWGGCEFSMTLKEIRTAATSYKATVSTAKTSSKSKKTSTKQVTKKSKVTWVYHKVRKGDTVWALVAASKAPYKNLKRPAINGKSYSACNWVMQKNQSAFSRKGDFKTLKVGAKIIVGQR